MQQKVILGFLVQWIIASVVLIGLNLVFPQSIVLGTNKLAGPMTAVFVGFLSTLFITFIPELLNKIDVKIKNEKLLGVIYFVGNASIIWFIKRFALIFGFGVSNLFFVILISMVISLCQMAVIKGISQILIEEN